MSRPVRKYIESNIPENMYLRLHHFHDGNDPKGRARRGFRYATKATLMSAHDHSEVCTAWARCSKSDSPRKSVSRMIAVGRALKQYYTKDETPF